MARTIIIGAHVLDGSGAPAHQVDVAFAEGVIVTVGTVSPQPDDIVIEAHGLTLAPGFIDVHTHDDLAVIVAPEMTAKVTQGVTTVVVGNCGISATTPFPSQAELPDPLVLLGPAAQFRYADFTAYANAVETARPATNVIALVGHTAMRARHMDRLDRAAQQAEREAMRSELAASLAAGAFGFSTGLAYANANAASTEEVMALADALRDSGALYCTHLRSEGAAIDEALDEAFAIARHGNAPVIVSHLKCAGAAQYGRSAAILARMEAAARQQSVACDCYPYSASSSTLDIKQVVPETPIRITWSDPEPTQAGRMLSEIAADWAVDLKTAASRLQPAGAVYHCMTEEDVDRILSHPLTMIGSDGLPCDPQPHPRLWGSFARVLGHYVRERAVLPLSKAVRKMTGLTADTLGLTDRGYVREGLAADLVLFDPAKIADCATYDDPQQTAAGIYGVWVNGVATVKAGSPTGRRGGAMLRRQSHSQQTEEMIK
ncbi:N-acyl-D-amino-acid deacylase family protein [Novosphingobium guangzhouense]|uniref:D-aminoacylase n=1 Tax=Novosphingobium guangzhouense TaxID=1850347 RepID=A0A2K2FU17_9SPHN|nr:D-aminoacylase [Novosphingobium guangzhouense]PNU02287.1 D-aminoacylase [Novosphingobium guangzhouense]